MSKELNVDLGTTGLTVTANVYLLSVVKATGIACAEIGVTGKYSGDFTATPNDAGVYQVAFFNGAATVSCGGGQIVWDGAAEVLQTGDNYARLGAPAGASVSADIAAIEAQTDDIGAGGAGLTALGDTRIANLDAPVSGRMATYTQPSGFLAATFPSDPADHSLVIAATNAITAAIAALNNLSAAQVNAEADTALADVGVTLARMGALTDWIDGGRLDLILDARSSQTSVDDLPTNAELATALATADDSALAQIALVKAKTDLLPSDPADQSLIIAATDAIIAAIADKTGYRLSATGVNDVLRTALTEGYAADGATMTVEQALHMIWSMLCDKAIVGTTLTTKKLDGATTAMTFTLAPSGTAPTSQVRST